MSNNYYIFSYHIGTELCVFIFLLLYHMELGGMFKTSSRVCFILVLRFSIKHMLSYRMILISVGHSLL